MGFGLSLGIISVGSNGSWGKDTAKCRQPHLPIHPRWCLFFFLPPLANDHCEQIEADFPSVSDHGISIAGWGVDCKPLREPAKNQDSSLVLSPSFAIFLNTDCCLGPYQSFSDLRWPQCYSSKTNAAFRKMLTPKKEIFSVVAGVTLAFLVYP